jgi:hypothetical protein
MGVVTGISLTRQVIYPRPELLLEALHSPGLYGFDHSETMALTGLGYTEDGPAPGLQCILHNAGQMGMMIVIQYSDTPHEYTKIISSDGNVKVSEDSTLKLCIDADVKMLECQHEHTAQATELPFIGPVWMYSHCTPGMRAFVRVTLFLFGLMHQLCGISYS